MKLKEISQNLKVGDVVWVKVEIKSIDEKKEGKDFRYFHFKGSLPNACFDAPVYGDTEVYSGDDILEENIVEKIVEIKNERTQGLVDAYEKILFNKKITIE